MAMVAAEESALEHPFSVDRQPPAPAGVLVWCFEGCMKPEQNQKRKELQSIAERYGSRCFFHKKAVTFLRWGFLKENVRAFFGVGGEDCSFGFHLAGPPIMKLLL